ncbi:hypothetical protein DQ239_00165 [Blastococcus sp. TF02-09]|nr:hypothetical protein DQ239_00165 [Blastococcus sp. TF02-9]
MMGTVLSCATFRGTSLYGGGALVAGSTDVDGGDVVTAEEFAAIFAALPTAYLVMSPDLTIVEANPAYLELLGRTRDELIGCYVFDAFPPAPETLDDTGANPLQLSFERARDTGRPDLMPLFRYQVLDQATGRPVDRAWSLISAPVPGPDGRTRLVLQRVEDVSEYLAERERLAEGRDDGGWARLDLLEADLFARTQELQAVVASREAATSRLAAMAQVVLQLAAAESVADVAGILADEGLAIGADGGAIALRHGAERSVRLTMTPSLGAGAQRRFATIDLDTRLPAAWVARTGETLVLEDLAQAEAWSPGLADAFRESVHRSWVTVPLSVGGRVLGSLLAGWRVERTFSADELDLVQAFAAQCAQALDRIESLTRERRSAERNRRLAEQLQRSMLSRPVRTEHCQIAVRYLPATDAGQVGGDWYDTFEQADGAVNLVIGDVVGHDIAAAATMGQLRSLLRGIAVAGAPGPGQVLDTLDAAIDQLGLQTYATVGVGRLERAQGERACGVTRLRWAGAGHPPPVVLDAAGGLVPVPAPRGRLMLGVDRTSTRGEIVVELLPGSTVLLYTDGLVERPGSDLDAGVERLHRLAAELVGLPLEELCDQLLDRLVDGRPSDDVALVAVRTRGQARERGAPDPGGLRRRVRVLARRQPRPGDDHHPALPAAGVAARPQHRPSAGAGVPAVLTGLRAGGRRARAHRGRRRPGRPGHRRAHVERAAARLAAVQPAHRGRRRTVDRHRHRRRARPCADPGQGAARGPGRIRAVRDRRPHRRARRPLRARAQARLGLPGQAPLTARERGGEPVGSPPPSSPAPTRAAARAAAGPSPAARSGTCSRTGSSAGSPGAPPRPARTGRRAPPR